MATITRVDLGRKLFAKGWVKRCFFALSLLFLPLLQAQTVVLTNPVGYVKFVCPGGSDTVVSVPFHQAPRWRGRLGSLPSSVGGGLVRLHFGGSPDFPPNALTTAPHYVHCLAGTGAAGRILVIAAHTADTADVVATDSDLNSLAAGDSIQVIPAWTLTTLFPPSTQNTLHPSASLLLPGRGSELLFFDDVTPGKTLAPRRRFFLTSSGWFESGTYAPAGNVAILPGQPFVIRHKGGSQSTSFVPHQHVFGGPITAKIRTRTSGEQDTMLAPPRPVAAKLSELGLTGTLFAESPTTNPGDRQDQLLVFDNSAAAQNKQPSAAYFRTPAGWVQDAPGFPPANNATIEPSSGILIRKAVASNDSGLIWLNQPNYDVTAP